MTASPPDPIPELDLAWAAGLFEGEGTVTIAVRNSDSTYRLIVTVGNTDGEVVDYFHQRWDGWKQPAYGERPGRQPAWYWTVAGPRAETFLTQLRPYLRTSRVQAKADLGLEFRRCQSRRTSVSQAEGYKDTQRALYERMKVLNLRGQAAVDAAAAQPAAPVPASRPPEPAGNPALPPRALGGARARLRPKARQILDVLVDAYPQALDERALTRALGRSSRTLHADLRELADLDLAVVDTGGAAAHPSLMSTS